MMRLFWRAVTVVVLVATLFLVRAEAASFSGDIVYSARPRFQVTSGHTYAHGIAVAAIDMSTGYVGGEPDIIDGDAEPLAHQDWNLPDLDRVTNQRAIVIYDPNTLIGLYTTAWDTGGNRTFLTQIEYDRLAAYETDPNTFDMTTAAPALDTGGGVASGRLKLAVAPEGGYNTSVSTYMELPNTVAAGLFRSDNVWDMTVDAQGNLYVAGRAEGENAGKIMKITKNDGVRSLSDTPGGRIGESHFTEAAAPLVSETGAWYTGIDTDNQLLYVVDFASKRVKAFDMAGNPVGAGIDLGNELGVVPEAAKVDPSFTGQVSYDTRLWVNVYDEAAVLGGGSPVIKLVVIDVDVDTGAMAVAKQISGEYLIENGTDYAYPNKGIDEIEVSPNGDVWVVDSRGSNDARHAIIPKAEADNALTVPDGGLISVISLPSASGLLTDKQSYHSRGAAFASPGSASCSTLFVDARAPEGGNGCSWSTAFADLQDALAVAVAGDEVRVAGGLYVPSERTEPSDPRTATFSLVSGVTIRGGYAGQLGPDPDRRDVGVFVTRLSGDLAGNDVEVALAADLLSESTRSENAYHVITAANVDAATELDGLMIIGGNANVPVSPHGAGGGMFTWNGAPTLTDCTFAGNAAIDAGGMYSWGCDLTLIRCAFIGNAASNDGGAILNDYQVQTTLAHCTLTGNVATGSGGAIHDYNECSSTLTGCTLGTNTAGIGGGGMYSGATSNLSLVNCELTGNSSTGGGGLYDDGGVAALVSCALTANRSLDQAGGMYVGPTSTSTLTNCTLAGNAAGTYGGGLYSDGGSLALKNCVLWANSDLGGTGESSQIRSDLSPPTIDYSCIEGWTDAWGGTGNIGDDPLLVSIPTDGGDGWGDDPNTPGVDEGGNDDFGNVHLTADSACINAGDPNGDYSGQIDMDEQPRVLDGRIEIGCDEHVDTLYVDDDSTDPNSADGLTWATSFADLQNALDAAAAGNEIRVAGGLYVPSKRTELSDPRTATFSLVSGVTLLGGYAGLADPNDPDVQDAVLHETVLSGDLDRNDVGGLSDPQRAENAYHVVTVTGCDSKTVLGDTTITGGQADEADDDTPWEPDGPETKGDGGGILACDTSLRVERCTLRENYAVYKGGGAYVSFSATEWTSCEFTQNRAAYGGGFCNHEGSAQVSDSTFSANEGNSGGAILSRFSSHLWLDGCRFEGNQATVGHGGAIHEGYGSTSLIADCLFADNQASDNHNGGAIFSVVDTDCTLRRCTFRGNTSSWADCVDTDSSKATLINCLLIGRPGKNQVRSIGADVSMRNCTMIGGNISLKASGFLPSYETFDIANCILWGGVQINDVSPTGTFDISYSCVEGGWPGEANINLDPQFVDPGNSNYRLALASPCVNTGSNAAVPMDVTVDLDGNLRIVGGVGDPNDPWYVLTVDRGAYEADSFVPLAFYYVDDDATDPNSADGLTWATAFANLQDALDVAGYGTEIRVAGGLYVPEYQTQAGDARSATFVLKSGVHIRGGYAGVGAVDPNARDLAAFPTVLSGDLDGDDLTGGDNSQNAYHVVTTSGATPEALLDGVTITGGNADGQAPFDAGGGIYNFQAGPTFARCTISGNEASRGGGLCDDTLAWSNMISCSVSGNAASTGAGVYTHDGTWSKLTNCKISNNTITGASLGGGFYSSDNTPLITGLRLSPGETGSAGVIRAGSQTRLEGYLWIEAGQLDVSSSDTASIKLHGTGTVDLAAGTALAITGAPGDLPAILHCDVSGSGNIIVPSGLGLQIAAGKQIDLSGGSADPDAFGVLVLDGLLSITGAPGDAPMVYTGKITGLGEIHVPAALTMVVRDGSVVDLSGGAGGSCGAGCVDPVGAGWGTITIDGSLLVQDSTVRNANVQVTLAEFEGSSNLINNDLRLVEASAGYGGQFYVAGRSAIECNRILSQGDRYLDLDPDPSIDPNDRPTICGNTIYVEITEGGSGEQGALLELRAADHDEGSLDCSGSVIDGSGAFCLAASAGYLDTWALEELEILTNAKVDLTNRQGFEFNGPGVQDVLYVKKLKLHPGAVLNTGLQRLYYQSLVDENDNALDPNQLTDDRRILDVPLLGFSLIVIDMEDQTELDVRVRTRLTDPNDVQPCACDGSCGDGAAPNPSACLAGMVRRIDDPIHDGVMEMRTHDPNVAGSASSVAAKGAFSRAGDEDVTVIFDYLFLDEGYAHDAELVVYLSDDPDVSEALVEVARVRPPMAGRPGSVDSDRMATFFGTFDRGSLNFTRGTYVEVELRGKGAQCWIDDWDPYIACIDICGNYDGVAGVSEVDYLYLLAEYGLSGRDPNKFCLDLITDGYVDLSDLLTWDLALDHPFWSLCPAPPPLPLAGGQAAGSELLPAGGPLGEGESTRGLLVAGKPKDDTYGYQNDVLYTVSPTGECMGDRALPDPNDPQARGYGRLMTDSAGRAYQLHATEGLIRLEDGKVVLSLQAGLSYQDKTVSVGVTGDDGLPLLDAAFAPSDPNTLYVVPVLVSGGGTTCPYKAAARLSLQGGGTCQVEALYGQDPSTDPLVTVKPVEGCKVVLEPDVQQVREVEVDGAGYVYVLSAQDLNENNWLLIYEPGGTERRILLTASPTRPDQVVGPSSPSCLLFSATDDRLYLTGSASYSQDVPRAEVFAYHFDKGTGAITLEDQIALAYPLPDLGDAFGLGYVAAATSVQQDACGSLYVVGFTMPRFPAADHPDDDQYLCPGCPLFSTPTLAAVPSDGGPAVTQNLICHDLALPLSAVFLGLPLGDLDCDGDVDLDDYVLLAAAMSGPGLAPSDPNVDLNGDGDCDLDDFAAFAASFTGPL